MQAAIQQPLSTEWVATATIVQYKLNFLKRFVFGHVLPHASGEGICEVRQSELVRSVSRTSSSTHII